MLLQGSLGLVPRFILFGWITASPRPLNQICPKESRESFGLSMAAAFITFRNII